jgi:trans-aconitate 2-methyltransferase
MTQAGWLPEQYLKFENERNRPANDLLSAIPSQNVKFAVDIGCGPGNSTELLLQRYPSAQIMGVDSSPEMIAKAKERLPSHEFQTADISTWAPAGKVDILYANAVMQWLPSHDKLFPRLLQSLNINGSLAIQMPDNLAEPAHLAMREAAEDNRWNKRISQANATRDDIGDASFYYDLLKPLSSYVDIWKTTYNHPLQGIEGIVEWFKGSGLRPYLSALEADERSLFLEKYREILKRHYKPMSNGLVLLPFPRLFIVATR